MTVDEQVYRWTLAALFFTGLAMSIWFRRRADRARGALSRRGDGPLFGAIQGVLGLAALGGIALYVIHPPLMAWSQLPLPAWLRLAGIPLGVIALGLFLWIFLSLGENVTPTARTRERHELVTSGPYRWVRHPMYSAGAIVFLVYFLLTANWFVGLACAATLVVIVRRTATEEANLLDRFGDEYREYMKRTGPFVPRPPRR